MKLRCLFRGHDDRFRPHPRPDCWTYFVVTCDYCGRRYRTGDLQIGGDREPDYERARSIVSRSVGEGTPPETPDETLNSALEHVESAAPLVEPPSPRAFRITDHMSTDARVIGEEPNQ